ncbi:MAG: 2Fe-2S iron-sulfur cluster-binding protein [Pseudanabaenaceae cyanobacterium]
MILSEPTTTMKDADAILTLEIDGEIKQTRKGTRLLSALLANHAKLLKACGGQGRCATCHVFINKGMENLTPPTDQELMTLSIMKITQENARLSCQCMILGSGISVTVPKGKYVGTEAELEALIGQRAEQALFHPITGEVLVDAGKLILRSALQKLQTVNQEFDTAMRSLVTRKFMKEK